MRARAAIVDMMGKLDIKRCESTAASAMKHVWMTDCKSLEEHLKNPTFSKCADKRLSNEVAALRQLLWMLPDETVVDELGELCPDTVRWIDTSTMPCDCLTKYMKPDRLLEMLETGILDLAATAQSILIKMRKQKSPKGLTADALGTVGTSCTDDARVVTKRVTGVSFTCYLALSSHAVVARRALEFMAQPKYRPPLT